MRSVVTTRRTSVHLQAAQRRRSSGKAFSLQRRRSSAAPCSASSLMDGVRHTSRAEIQQARQDADLRKARALYATDRDRETASANMRRLAKEWAPRNGLRSAVSPKSVAEAIRNMSARRTRAAGSSGRPLQPL